MDIQRKTIFLAFFILFIPSILSADTQVKTGYDLYHHIKRMDDPENLALSSFTLGFMVGVLDGLVLMQDLMFQRMFPPETLTPKEIENASKEIGFNRLNLPKEGIKAVQLSLIYKKYAESHPEKLSESARVCVFLSLVEAYGWK